MDKTTLFSIALLVAAAMFEFSIRQTPAVPASNTSLPAEPRVTLESPLAAPEKRQSPENELQPSWTLMPDNIGSLEPSENKNS
jgi:hypothetical protein